MKCDVCGLSKFVDSPCLKGKGSYSAKVLALNDFPSYDEITKGESFSGKDTAYLFKLVDKFRDDMYFTNLVKCFPPRDIITPSNGYRQPAQVEIESCMYFLGKELTVLPRDITIMGLGSTVVSHFITDMKSLSDVVGEEYEIQIYVGSELRKYRFVPNYSHKFVERNPNRIKDFKAALNLSFGLEAEKEEVHFKILDPKESVELLMFYSELGKKGELDYIFTDTETTGFNMDKNKIIMVQVGTEFDEISYSIPLMVTNEVHWTDLPYDIPPPINFTVNEFQVGKIRRAFRDMTSNLRGGVVGHNIKFDLKFLLAHDFIKSCDIRVKGDTFSMANVLLGKSMGFSLSLKELCQTLFGLGSSWGTQIETYINRFRLIKDRTFDKVPTAVLGKYGAEDIHWTKRLFRYLMEMAVNRGETEEIFRILFRLSEIYSRAEYRGVKVDDDMYGLILHESKGFLDKSGDLILAADMVKKLTNDIVARNIKAIRDAKGADCPINEDKIRDTAFSLTSNQNMAELFYGKGYFNQPVKFKTDKGAPSVNKESLTMISKVAKDESCRNVALQLLEYKTFSKIKSTYLDSIPDHTVDGFYKPEFNISGTVTGRLSSGFHIMPSKSDLKRMFKSGFTNGFFGAPDFSQLELRVLAARSKDENWIAGFIKGIDKHLGTAMDMFKVDDPTKITKSMRKAAKAINFGVVFGKGAQSLAEDLGCSMAEAEEYLRMFFEGSPGVSKYIDEQHEFAKINGFIVTKFGRFIHIPEAMNSNKWRMLEGCRRAVNNDIQSTASDLVSSCFEHIDTEFKENNMKSVLQGSVHDSLEPDIYPTELFQAIRIMKYSGEGYLMDRYKDWLVCPIVLDMEFGKWWSGVEFNIEEITDSKGVFVTKAATLRKDLLILEEHASKTYHTKLEVLGEETIDELPLNIFLRDNRKWTARLTLEL